MTIKVSVELDSMTFGDLYDFVDLARGAGVDREKLVAQVPLPNYEDMGPDRFELDLDKVDLREAPDFTGIDRKSMVEMLDFIIEQGGDARYALDGLKELRDRLI